MRVLVLGGAGGMGRVAAQNAAAFDFVAAVTVADLSLAGAGEVARQIGAKAAAAGIDVKDRDGMRALIERHDVVFNAVGPFYIHGVPILEQVIEAGRHYADICDDWEPTIDMLDLDGRARARGVLAVIGMGASPGVTNLLAMKAASQLDHVEEILTGWSIEASSEDTSALQSSTEGGAAASAAVVHWVQQLTGQIRVFADGAFQDVKPLQRREIQYPGYGALPVWSVGHPEAITLPRTVLGVQACTNVMVGPEESFQGLAALAALVDAGAMSIDQAANEIAEGAQSGSLTSADGRDLRKPALFAWARGTRNGHAAVSAAQMLSLPPGGMAGATSVPLALTLPLFQRGLAAQSGVCAPEAVIDPDAFFDLLAPYCAGDFPAGRDLVALDLVVHEGADA